MEAKELRIGNYVRWNNTAVSQMELSDFSNWYNDENSHEYGDFIKPLPLTEEWLLKFGFKFKEEYKEFYLKNITLSVRKNFFEFDYYGDIVNIKYVHQLQNLYFALTGEELTLKQ